MADCKTSREDWTVGRMLEWTTGYFGQRGLETPRLDAEVLLADVLDCQRIELYTMYDSEVGPDDRARYRELLKRRAAGCPTAYLVGAKEFYGLRLELDSNVLVPRPESEHLVSEALKFSRQDRLDRFADVGTGCGAIAVALCKELPEVHGIAGDLSPEVLKVARRNAESHGVADRLEFIESDLLGNIPPDPLLDLIVCNPPYVASEEFEDLPVEVREYEPRLALDGGPGGLEVIRRLIEQVSRHLRPGGLLLLEIGASQNDQVRRLLGEESLLEVGRTVEDSSGLPRVLCASRRQVPEGVGVHVSFEKDG